MAHIFREILGIELKTPFPSMTYEEAMSRMEQTNLISGLPWSLSMFLHL